MIRYHFKQAIAAGGEEQKPVQDQFYGDRSALKDPFGHVWLVATHKEDVALRNEKRMAAAGHVWLSDDVSVRRDYHSHRGFSPVIMRRKKTLNRVQRFLFCAKSIGSPGNR